MDDSRFCSKCGTPIHPSEDIQFSQTRTILRPMDELPPGTMLAGKYRIEKVLGRGGMGVVYKAEDTKLKRNVALKFLPPELTRDKEARERFVLEARAAAALSHPKICTIYEIDEEEGKSFIAMEFVEGENLKSKLEKSPPQLEEALDIAVQVAEGLEEAHKKGIIHRDIKSSNIMVTDKGQAKIMDFGLAKVKGGSLLTREGTTLGTVAYMPPEQARGEEVSHRSDIWSLGVVIYEMLCGELPFKGDHEASILYSVVHEEPKRIKEIKPDIPPEVEQVIIRALKKKPESRYSSAAEMLKDLKAYLTSLRAPEVGITDFRSFVRHIRKPRFAVPAVLFFLVLCSVAVWFINRGTMKGWARKEALPEIRRLVEEDNDYAAAYRLAQQAEKYIPKDPQLIELWPEISREVSILTTPPGADVYIRDYIAVDSDWEYFGQTPIEKKRTPRGLLYRWKIEKQGFTTIEVADYAKNPPVNYELDKEGSIPKEMIRVQKGSISPILLMTAGSSEGMELDSFLIDKYEVTNKQYKEFVDKGGYQRQEYWKNEFIENGQVLSWKEAMAEFRDTTGVLGPSTWEVGSFPEGQEDYPVTGISWYEAAAYAEYVGKRLPTIYHWIRAAGDMLYLSNIILLSNFSGRSPVLCGSQGGMSPSGVYDMAGNAREWGWNGSDGMRYILGGAWDDRPYMFNFPHVISPMDRSKYNGFRCMKSISPGSIPENTTRPLPLAEFRDYSKEQPVSDEIFLSYIHFYSYEKKELNSAIEEIDNTPDLWIKQKVTFDAAYGNEQMMAYLFLPKNIDPPYQTVVWFPGAGDLNKRSSKNIWDDDLDFVLKTGRALMYPVYKSTFERGDGFSMPPSSRESYKNHVVFWYQDLARSIDYLETNPDIDTEKLAYLGGSWGAHMGSIFLALEKRFKACILVAGGFLIGPGSKLIPQIDQINFTPRIRLPTLMINGRYDFLFPYETSQLPMFRSLGTLDKDKDHKVFETSHFLPWNEVIKESIVWLDRYLGPVK
jgi:serine/threonine protein kinase/dienelactone hydrolase